MDKINLQKFELVAKITFMILILAVAQSVFAQVTPLPPAQVAVSVSCVSTTQVEASISITNHQSALWDYNLYIQDIGGLGGISSRGTAKVVTLDHNKTYQGEIQNWNLNPSPTFTITAPDCSGNGGSSQSSSGGGNSDTRSIEELRATLQNLLSRLGNLQGGRTMSGLSTSGNSSSNVANTAAGNGVTTSVKCVNSTQVSVDVSINRNAPWDYNLYIDGLGGQGGISSRGVARTLTLDHNQTYTGNVNNWDIGSVGFSFVAPDCGSANSDSGSRGICTQDESGSPNSCLRNTDPERWAELNKKWQQDNNVNVTDVRELLEQIIARLSELLKSR